MDNKLIGNENNIIFYEDKEGNRKVLRKKEYYNLDMNTIYQINKFFNIENIDIAISYMDIIYLTQYFTLW
mgnify:CR=1 FL=1